MAKAVEVVAEEKINERIKIAKEKFAFGGSEDNSEHNSLLENTTDSQSVAEDAKDDAKDNAKKSVEEEEQTTKISSDFRKWVGDHPLEEPTKPKTAHERLGTMWLDFVETKVMKSIFCRAACGNFDDETTTASTATYNSEDVLAAYALASTPRLEKVSPRKQRASKSHKTHKRKSSRRTRRTRHDKR